MGEIATEAAESLAEGRMGDELNLPPDPDEHPLDEHLGSISEMALALYAKFGMVADAQCLAKAHEAIQRHVIAVESERDRLAARVAELESEQGEILVDRNSLLIQFQAMTRQRDTLAAALENLCDALEVCHVCEGILALDEVEPTHCENCSWDCEDHPEPQCTPLYQVVAKARAALALLKEPGSETKGG